MSNGPDYVLFQDQPVNDAMATIAILVGAMIAAGGGLGGGGVFVPIYILILTYEPKFAAALSQATIFGGSIVNLIMNMKKRHPERNHRPLTDFTTLLIFEPMLLVGTVVGVLLNVMFPDIMILILLVVVLSYATVRTTRKGIRTWKKESQSQSEIVTEDVQKDRTNLVRVNPSDPSFSSTEKEKIIQDLPNISIDNSASHTQKKAAPDEQIKDNSIDIDNDNDNNNDNDNDNDNNGNIEMQNMNESNTAKKKLPVADSSLSPGRMDDEKTESIDPLEVSTMNKDGKLGEMSDGLGVDMSLLETFTQEKLDELQAIIDVEADQVKPLIFIFVVWVVASLTSILKQEEITGVEQCSGGYWVLNFLSFPIMLGVAFYLTKREYFVYQAKVDSGGWQPAVGDIKWNQSIMNVIRYPLIAAVAGTLGGLLGIGGGMIVSPLLMELGVIPLVAAATSAMAVLVTSSSATLQFLLLGYLKFDYMMWFMFIGVVGTFMGQTIINHSIKKYGRVSLVVFAVAAIMGFAILLMAINGIIEIAKGISWAFTSPCE